MEGDELRSKGRREEATHCGKEEERKERERKRKGRGIQAPRCKSVWYVQRRAHKGSRSEIKWEKSEKCW